MTSDSTARPRRAQLMAAALFGMGTLHFVVPGPFDSIVPPALPGKARSYTYWSGVAELTVATTLALPRTRRLGGLLAALLFIAVYPANVQMAVDSVRNPKAPTALKAISILRLPLQFPMIRQALKVRREAA
ncbi:putative membrane protein [Nocardia transvalensis]|uniref:Putative membrane protein n=1 Tax=Nocardia transvalensis TaxID=37333 RepID=A0A7W9PA62_9NOCA|nr:membrane protein [Nocardia transvalensis]MBB5912246.1 putative membrane protein [Nocardia transvalensis]